MSFATSSMIPTVSAGRRRDPVLVVSDVWLCAILLLTFTPFEPVLMSWAMRLVSLAFLLVYIPCHFRYRVRIAPEIWLSGLFLLWSFGSGLYVAVDSAGFYHYSGNLARFIGLSVAVAGFAYAKRSATANMLILTCLALYLSLVARWTGTYGAGLEVGGSFDSGDFLMNQNTFGMMILLGLVGLAYAWKSDVSRPLRWIMPPVAVWLAFSLVSSASRKSFLGLVGFIMLWLLFCYGRQFFRRPGAAMMAIVVLAGTAYFSSYVMRATRLGARLEQTEEVGGLDKTRIGMYELGWELFTQYPIAGVGLAGFATFHPLGEYSHSDYIETLSTTGIVGFVLYFLIYFVLWMRLRRIGKRATNPTLRYQVGVLKAVLVTMLLLSIGVTHFLSLYSWYLLASIIGFTYALDRRESSVRSIGASRFPIVAPSPQGSPRGLRGQPQHGSRP